MASHERYLFRLSLACSGILLLRLSIPPMQYAAIANIYDLIANYHSYTGFVIAIMYAQMFVLPYLIETDTIIVLLLFIYVTQLIISLLGSVIFYVYGKSRIGDVGVTNMYIDAGFWMLASCCTIYYSSKWVHALINRRKR